MVETVALYSIFGHGKTKTQAIYWWGFSTYTQFTGEIIVILYSIMEDSLPASKKSKGNEWVRRITNVNTGLQRKTVYLCKKKQTKKQHFRGVNCTMSEKKNPAHCNTLQTPAPE